jgi:hypothetical protein
MPKTKAKLAVQFLVAARHCEIEGLKLLLEAGRLVLSISSLVHCLQRERGASNLYLGSAGQCYQQQLLSYQDAAAEAEQELQQGLQSWLAQQRCPHGCARFFSRIAMVMHSLSALPELREQIRARELALQPAMHSFNELIRGLLAVVFEAADSAADPQISRALVALFNFMQGKELAGQERAIGAAGFSLGGFDETLKQALLNRIEAQEHCFQIFTEFCDPDALKRWQQVLISPHSTEVERLRRIASTRQVPPGGGVELAKIWFEQTTHRIDAMKHVEEGLEAYLEQLCLTRIESASGELSSAQATTAALSALLEGSEAHSLVHPMLEAEMAIPPTNRSVMDLVHLQSRRLQAMEDELQAARQALAERRVLERAKALLMQHRQLSEDEAHRFLRQSAMNQNRRISEVAEAIVSMADVLG